MTALIEPAQVSAALIEEGSQLDAVLHVVALVIVLFGALLCLTASIGLVRFRDVLWRLHPATKPQVLGLLLICVAVAIENHSWSVAAFIVPIVLIQLASAPLSAHMVGRAAYRNGTYDERSLLVDELRNAPGSTGTPPYTDR